MSSEKIEIELSAGLKEFLDSLIKSGLFIDESDVIRDALRRLAGDLKIEVGGIKMPKHSKRDLAFTIPPASYQDNTAALLSASAAIPASAKGSIAASGLSTEKINNIVQDVLNQYLGAQGDNVELGDDLALFGKAPIAEKTATSPSKKKKSQLLDIWEDLL